MNTLTSSRTRIHPALSLGLAWVGILLLLLLTHPSGRLAAAGPDPASPGAPHVPAATKTEVVLDLLYGPLYHRLLHGHAPLDEAFTADVVDTVLAGLG